MQLDERHVRGIALQPTQGLARGMAVEDTGGPLKVPVGKEIISRMFDVFGNPIDRQPAPADVEWRTIHRDPPSLASRSTKSEVFETGIKVIDVLVPLERGGKAGLFGGAGVGKTVLLTCEPTTHRFVRRAFHPTPHHPLECRPEPTPSTPAHGGSGLHCRSGASRASSTGGRWSGSAARVLPPICEVSRVVTGTDAGNGGTGANERPSVANSNCLCHQSKRCAVGPRRQKRSDALSEKTKRCAVGSHSPK